MSRRMDWDRARRRGLVVDRGGDPAFELKEAVGRGPRGPSGEQQKEVSRLCKKLGVPYTYSKTADEAGQQIYDLSRQRTREL